MKCENYFRESRCVVPKSEESRSAGSERDRTIEESDLKGFPNLRIKMMIHCFQADEKVCVDQN